VSKKQGLKRRLLAGVGLVSLVAAGSASAADIAPLKAPPAPVWSWSGLYLGAHAGYGWGHDPFTDTIFAGKAPLLGINSKGGVWGFHAGANWQEGALVGGIEIDISGTGIKGSSSVSSTLTIGPDTITTTTTQTDKFDWLGSARARLGYLVVPNVLVYGTGGLAWTRFVQTQDQSIFLSIPPDTVTIAASNSTPSWRFGFAVGAGVEARLWDTNWLGRVEYLHYDFGDSGSSGSTSGSSFASDHLTVDVVRAGLSYKFDRDRLAVAAGYPAMPVKAPRAAPVVWSWSGFYIGAHAGYGWGRDPQINPFDTGLVLTDIDSNGFVGGFQAGGNWQSAAWVGGLEIDLSGTGIKGSTSGTAGARTVTQTDKFELLGSARPRIGFLPWPNLLVYGTGGLAWTRLVQTTTDVRDAFSSTNANPSWRFGWVAGIGGETRLWDSNWLARLEYLHYDFGDSGSRFSTGNPSFTTSNLTVDVVRAGLSYKFGQDLFAAAGPMVMPVKAPRAVAAAWTWSGYYLGGHAGYGWGRDPQSDTIFGGKVTNFPLFGDINSRGFVAGFQAGGNWQMGAWVTGLEIDLSGTGIKGSTTSVTSDGTTITTETLTDKFKMLGSARARLGYLVPLPWQNVLFYGTGGLAWTRLEQEDVRVFAGGANGSTTPFWKFGWVAGVGGEARLWDSNWLMRLEYLHYDFGDSRNFAESVSETTVAPANASLSRTTGHLTADVVRTGLSFKFD
jgi:outer membrane immunogenic protein